MLYETLKKDAQVCAYIKAGNDALAVLGYTEHSLTHVCKTAETAALIMTELGFSEKEVEQVKIAGLMHDIGNMVNRSYHAHSGAEIARTVLEKHGMPFEDIGIICIAIGNHDEGTGKPISTVSAALILADKSDVRRSRVQECDMDKIMADIHDRVNYAVTRSEVIVSREGGRACVRLCLDIDTSFCAVMDYFEIFLTRMVICRHAAAFLNADFSLVINGMKMI
ncbi:MAG: HD domain-containing protein [Clostridiales bacterium]|jgi:putative nucleotidyltransferase with HDIG domain|nr:HD domain-containing protein [Clostridiales bacterium]